MDAVEGASFQQNRFLLELNCLKGGVFSINGFPENKGCRQGGARLVANGIVHVRTAWSLTTVVLEESHEALGPPGCSVAGVAEKGWRLKFASDPLVHCRYEETHGKEVAASVPHVSWINIARFFAPLGGFSFAKMKRWLLVRPGSPRSQVRFFFFFNNVTN